LKTTKIVLGILFAICVIPFVVLLVKVWFYGLPFGAVVNWMVATGFFGSVFGFFLFKGR